MLCPPEQRYGGLHAKERGGQIDRDGLLPDLPDFGPGFHHSAVDEHASCVHQPVEASERVGRSRHRTGNLGGIGHVHGEGGPANGPRDGFGLRGVAVEYGHRRTFPAKQFRGRATYSGSAAGDGDFSPCKS
jgi:hypothetical protein